jgi:hypothetical protein
MTQRTPVVIPGLDKEIFLDFKILPCSECHMLSSGLFTGICSLNANISEHTVCSEALAFKLGAGEQSRRKRTTKKSLFSNTVVTGFPTGKVRLANQCM